MFKTPEESQLLIDNQLVMLIIAFVSVKNHDC